MKPVTASLCILEPQLAEHAGEMFQVLSDPAIYEFENQAPTSEQALRDRFRRLERRGSDDGKQVWLNWVLRLPTGELAGYVQATVLRTGHCHVAYELHSKFWRQGIGSSAVDAMLGELAREYAATHAIAVLKAQNFRSEGLLLKLGFQRACPAEEARHRDSDDELVYATTLQQPKHAA